MTRLAFVISDMGMGGAQRVVSLLAARLAQTGCTTHIVTLTDQTQKSFFPLPPAVGLISLGLTGSSPNIFSTLNSNARRIRLVRHTLKKLKPDGVISFQTETNCTTLLAMAGTGIPVIVSERSDPYIHPQAKIWRFIRRFVYPLAAGAVLQTRHAARFFKGIVKNRVVIFNPVHTDNYEECDAPADPYILGVGRLSSEKGFHDLIAAHALAKKSCQNLKLVLLGEGPEREALEKYAGELGTRADIVFAGAQKVTTPFYRASLAFVLPSHFEGLPNALLEAMSLGCAVISTPLFAAAPEIIDHGQNGLIARNGAPEAMAEEIEKLYKNSDLRESLGQNAKLGSSRFSTEFILNEWINFFKVTGLNL